MLTISQLADYVGVTVRAVRHYHQRGLLPEPDRDHSGYRRYDAQAVIDLIRIKTLAEAGVPLARIEELLAADAEQFTDAVAEIDRSMQDQIRELKERRRRVAQLASGERLFLPTEIAEYIEELRAVGVSDRGVLMERDGWVILAAAYPELAPRWIAHKRADLADPEYRDFYVTYDQAHDWQVDDPRLEALADTMAERFGKQLAEAGDQADELRMEKVLSAEEQKLFAEYVNDYSPAWVRLNEMVAKRIAR
ncbi:transcriptional regulator, MerR family [Catenulispora acidiphila DSM 44928]|uniref:Transcriptional regulator, MerR family n=1 Tax=Catenulispora acidiphila (strain DSM 44928 / JCM 14897 / NBRC 102108 / NRRL B-24433 / ID139908) TaxID=479433 RepID=C7Q3S9_CATAD|nr:MerR family transcriptional regulator [Catenulispora acidiphila]ACU77687.1 transcriptional regulator, MerR family [Catenulispora acidiphila DSM 44928]